MAAGAGLGRLAAFEMERLHPHHLVPGEAEAGGGVFVEVAAVRGLLLGQHAAFAGGDAGAGKLGAARERDLGRLRQRAEAHVGDDQRDFQRQRLLRIRADHDLGADRLVVEPRRRSQAAR